VKSYWLRHFLISSLRDIDIKGFRKLSLLLPKILLPRPENVNPYVLKNLYGFLLEIDPKNDWGVERSLHETGTYEKGVLTFLSNCLKKGDVFIDVGANIGLMAIHASRCVGNTGKVIAVEANPLTIPILEKNVSLNDSSNISIVNKALGAVQGKGIIYENRSVNRGGASLVINQDAEKGHSIDILPLDEVFDHASSVKVIKIDVEGYELEVLKGAQKLIAAHRPILIVETSAEVKVNHDVVAFVKSMHNYKVCIFSKGKERKSKIQELQNLNAIPVHDNLVFLP